MLWDWAAFTGSLTGATIGVVLLVLGILAYDEWSKRRSGQSQSTPIQATITRHRAANTEDILEYHLEKHIEQHFESLFPGWKIYESSTSRKGIRFRTEAGEIDFICLDKNDNFVILELKRDKAPDTIVAQIDRYIAYAKKHLATNRQTVRGVIIAKSLDKRLQWALDERKDLQFYLYQWHLSMNRASSVDPAIRVNPDL